MRINLCIIRQENKMFHIKRYDWIISVARCSYWLALFNAVKFIIALLVGDSFNGFRKEKGFLSLFNGIFLLVCFSVILDISGIYST